MPRVAEGHISEPQWESGQSCAPHPRPSSASPPPAPVQPVLDLGPKALPAGRASARRHLLRKPAGLHTHQLILVCLLMRSSVEPRYQRLR